MKSIKNVSSRKLALHTATIRRLGEIELGHVQGGAVSFGPNCSEGLNFCQPERRTSRC